MLIQTSALSDWLVVLDCKSMSSKKKKRPSPFSVNSMRRQVLCRVAQEMQVDMVTAQSETR